MSAVEWAAARIRHLRLLVGALGGRDARCREGRRNAEPGCREEGCDAFPLVEARPGEALVVSCLEAPDAPGGGALVSLGLLPGVRLVLLQRRPAWVVRIGWSEFALDGELARRVRVVPDGDSDRNPEAGHAEVPAAPAVTTGRRGAVVREDTGGADGRSGERG